MKTKILIAATAAFMLCACTHQTQTNKDMPQLSFTTEQAAAMSVIACNEAKGELDALAPAIHSGLDAGLTVSQSNQRSPLATLCLHGFSSQS